MLKELAKLQSHLQVQGSKRHQIAENQYLQALSLVSEALGQNFSDRSLVQRAGSRLLDAIRHNRQDPRPYVAMAYLLLLFDDRRQALGYIKAALSLSPASQDALNLKAWIEQHPIQNRPAGPTLHPPGSTPGEDPYEAERRFGFGYLQTLLRDTPGQLAPGTDPDLGQRYQSKAEEITAVHAEAASRIARLEREADVAGLWQTLQLIEKVAQRYRRAAGLCARFRELETRMREQIQTITVFRPTSESENERQLEAWLDQCDACADALDALEAEGLTIDSLHGTYRQLMRHLEAARDRLDGMTD